MVNSDLVRLFGKLSKAEHRRLFDFVKSPYFNHRADVIRLCEYLLQSTDKTGGYLKKAAAYKYVFPDEVYDDGKIRYAMSFLLNHIKKFLAHEALKEDSVQEKINTVGKLRTLGEEKLFEKEWKRLHKEIEARPLRNERYAYDNFRLFSEKYEHLSRQSRSGDKHLEDTVVHLSDFYFAGIMKQGCLLAAQNRLSAVTNDFTLPDTAATYLSENPAQLKPVTGAFFHCYRCLSDPENEADFHKMKVIIFEHGALFTQKELRDLYLAGVNYSIQKMNTGKRFYLKEAFDLFIYLYRSGLEKEVFLDDGYLSRFLFKNIMVAGLVLNEKEWVESFLENYRGVLYPKNSSNFYSYCQAVFYYRTGNYAAAMPILSRVDFYDTLYNLDGRKMLMLIYFEQDEVDALYAHLDSFSTFLRRRKKELNYHAVIFSNLIAMVKKLLRSNLNDKKTRVALTEEIKNKENLTEKKWLLKQLERERF